VHRSFLIYNEILLNSINRNQTYRKNNSVTVLCVYVVFTLYSIGDQMKNKKRLGHILPRSTSHVELVVLSARNVYSWLSSVLLVKCVRNNTCRSNNNCRLLVAYFIKLIKLSGVTTVRRGEAAASGRQAIKGSSTRRDTFPEN